MQILEAQHLAAVSASCSKIFIRIWQASRAGRFRRPYGVLSLSETPQICRQQAGLGRPSMCLSDEVCAGAAAVAQAPKVAGLALGIVRKVLRLGGSTRGHHAHHGHHGHHGHHAHHGVIGPQASFRPARSRCRAC